MENSIKNLDMQLNLNEENDFKIDNKQTIFKCIKKQKNTNIIDKTGEYIKKDVNVYYGNNTFINIKKNKNKHGKNNNKTDFLNKPITNYFNKKLKVSKKIKNNICSKSLNSRNSCSYFSVNNKDFCSNGIDMNKESESKTFFKCLETNIEENLINSYILLNDEQIEKIHNSINKLNKEFESALYSNINEMFPYLSTLNNKENFKNYERMLNINSKSLLLKFLLQEKSEFVYLPNVIVDNANNNNNNDNSLNVINTSKCIISKNKFKINSIESSLLKLIENFDSNKEITLIYPDLNNLEVSNIELYDYISKYIKTAKNKSIRNKHKALVIYSNTDDILNVCKIVDTICNELNYSILKLDELDNDKNTKIQKKAEAFQSERISLVKYDVNKKLKILGNILNNNPTLIKSLVKSCNYNNNRYYNQEEKQCNSVNTKNTNIYNNNNNSLNKGLSFNQSNYNLDKYITNKENIKIKKKTKRNKDSKLNLDNININISISNYINVNNSSISQNNLSYNNNNNSINNHSLYNVLNNINSFSYINKANNIKDFIKICNNNNTNYNERNNVTNNYTKELESQDSFSEDVINYLDKIYQHLTNKRSLVLITENYKTNIDGKNYLMQLINKIPQSKCPFIIVTNDLKQFYSKISGSISYNNNSNANLKVSLDLEESISSNIHDKSYLFNKNYINYFKFIKVNKEITTIQESYISILCKSCFIFYLHFFFTDFLISLNEYCDLYENLFLLNNEKFNTYTEKIDYINTLAFNLKAFINDDLLINLNDEDDYNIDIISKEFGEEYIITKHIIDEIIKISISIVLFYNYNEEGILRHFKNIFNNYNSIEYRNGKNILKIKDIFYHIENKNNDLNNYKDINNENKYLFNKNINYSNYEEINKNNNNNKEEKIITNFNMINSIDTNVNNNVNINYTKSSIRHKSIELSDIIKDTNSKDLNVVNNKLNFYKNKILKIKNINSNLINTISNNTTVSNNKLINSKISNREESFNISKECNSFKPKSKIISKLEQLDNIYCLESFKDILLSTQENNSTIDYSLSKYKKDLWSCEIKSFKYNITKNKQYKNNKTHNYINMQNGYENITSIINNGSIYKHNNTYNEYIIDIYNFNIFSYDKNVENFIYILNNFIEKLSYKIDSNFTIDSINTILNITKAKHKLLKSNYMLLKFIFSKSKFNVLSEVKQNNLFIIIDFLKCLFSMTKNNFNRFLKGNNFKQTRRNNNNDEFDQLLNNNKNLYKDFIHNNIVWKIKNFVNNIPLDKGSNSTIKVYEALLYDFLNIYDYYSFIILFNNNMYIDLSNLDYYEKVVCFEELSKIY